MSALSGLKRASGFRPIKTRTASLVYNFKHVNILYIKNTKWNELLHKEN